MLNSLKSRKFFTCMKQKRGYTKWCWWWFFNTIFCIHKISSQCYKMKLYQLQLNLSFPPSFPSNVANQRQEFIQESTPAETQAVLIRNRTNLKKHRRNRREQKNSTPFLKWSFRGHQHHLTKTHKKNARSKSDGRFQTAIILFIFQ